MAVSYVVKSIKNEVEKPQKRLNKISLVDIITSEMEDKPTKQFIMGLLENAVYLKYMDVIHAPWTPYPVYKGSFVKV